MLIPSLLNHPMTTHARDVSKWKAIILKRRVHWQGRRKISSDVFCPSKVYAKLKIMIGGASNKVLRKINCNILGCLFFRTNRGCNDFFHHLIILFSSSRCLFLFHRHKGDDHLCLLPISLIFIQQCRCHTLHVVMLDKENKSATWI